MTSENKHTCPKCNTNKVKRIYAWRDVGIRLILEVLALGFIIGGFSSGDYWGLASFIGFIILIGFEIKYPRKKTFFCESCFEKFSP